MLESLNLNNFRTVFKQNQVDGLTLQNCHSVEDVMELGISITAKARVLFHEINIYKVSGVSSNKLQNLYKYNKKV